MKSYLRFICALIIFSGLLCVCSFLPGIVAAIPVHEALFYQKLDNKKVKCQLCPRYCVILPGKRGYCRVRENQDGRLVSISYAKPVAIHIDPIEKKPLFHFLPSKTAFSVATAGCNLNCKFCQNWEISQGRPEELSFTSLTPQELVNKAKESFSPAVAFTYTEPTVFYEYMLETAQLARSLGLKNVMHSNGYINEQPLRRLAKYLDAANIDLKGFKEEYYAKICEGSLEPVLKSLKVLKEEGVHLEITNLVLSGFNDDPESITRMCIWIKDNLGAQTPLHFSRFFPMYKLLGLNPTPVETLENAGKIAINCGLKYVYVGNVPGHSAENTFCPKCGKIVIKRSGYIVQELNLLDGKCKFCGEKIEGVWE
ncbi:MAG: AmmeMemoRadiSam system radical SAM enzyme [Candidatus Omnitrophica bacterium]|nr:AmmeMemoRadiSam system radical SAM enzyme [Candidatus Omnitrophota bacterium]